MLKCLQYVILSCNGLFLYTSCISTSSVKQEKHVLESSNEGIISRLLYFQAAFKIFLLQMMATFCLIHVSLSQKSQKVVGSDLSLAGGY